MSLDVSVSRETHDRLKTFLGLLEAWNPKINLVGPGTPGSWWARHVEDSIQLASLLPDGAGPCADLGSGGGFPGIVLATMQDRNFHLIESDQRKCAFLREACRALSLTKVTIHGVRIEDVILPPLAAITARALAPLSSLLVHAHRLLAPDGMAIFPKGRNARAELTAATTHWHMTTQCFASCTDPEATILRIRDIRPA
jgi:16S rRNA (guanine527-N7)-methyltransferase